jgi:hypothetical protein
MPAHDRAGRLTDTPPERQKAKSKRQKAKGRIEENQSDPRFQPGLLPFAFCFLPFALL